MEKQQAGVARPYLFAFAVFTAASALALLLSGGLVTSKGVGMSVPDWPTTYGYNMFWFPFDRWVGGIFYEHFHRLIASAVGLLTVVLALLLWAFERRRWVRVLGLVAVAAVIVQGVLGGLRVVLIKNEIGIFHGMLAQAYIALLVVIAVSLSKGFATRAERWNSPYLVRWAIALTVLVYLQLAVGAAMRHQHAGLAIRDFPLAYGRVWPAVTAEQLPEINAARIADGEVPTTLGQIHLQMAHRAIAVTILCGVGAYAWVARKAAPGARRASFGWLGLVVLQIGLGGWTVLSGKAADITTAHVAVGALVLFLGVVQCFLLASSSPRRSEP